MQVFGGDAAFPGVGGVAVGRAVDLAAADAAAGHRHGEDRAPVAPPAADELGRAAELGHADDQGLVEHALGR